MARGWHFSERETEARSASEQLSCLPAVAVPRVPPSVIQTESPPGEVAAVPLPAGQSQHPVPTESWWLPHRAGEEHTETGTEAPRAHTEPSRSRDRAVWQPAVPKHGPPGAGGECALSCPAGRLMAGSLPVLGLWMALGQAGPSRAPLPWRCWRSAPGVTGVPSLAGQWLMWLRESPVTREMTLIQRLFPAQLGRALARLQTRRCRSLCLAHPSQHRGRTRAWGRALDGGTRSHRGALPAWPWGDTASCSEPRRLSVETPRECF